MDLHVEKQQVQFYSFSFCGETYRPTTRSRNICVMFHLRYSNILNPIDIHNYGMHTASSLSSYS